METEKPKSAALLNNLLPYFAWTIALCATAGSLFFSFVMELPPCDLCWYQRIGLFPLVFIIGTGIVLSDRRWKIYALPFCVFGLAVAVYHNLLYYKLIPQPIVPCSAGVSCTETQLELFGFLTIPLMSLIAFVLVTICILLYRTKEK